jgi:NADPH-dependent FMN reductase.
MTVLVINGSPKGKYSTTLHTCLFLEKKFPEIQFSYIYAGQKIKSLEKDFTPALEQIRESDLLLFCYPVYTFLAPYQLHRFIELMKESGEDFSAKVATQVTTSKHFYDITAHKFIEENCNDMGIPFIDGLSADMDDLLNEKGQKQALDWMAYTLWKYARKEFKECSPMKFSYSPSKAEVPESSEKRDGRKAVIVADLLPGDKQLNEMVERFTAIFPYECDIVNIEDFPFMGGCLSCFNCSTTGKCIYKDGFDEFLRNTIHKHDAIIYAFRIKDHSMGSRFKMYDDRQFCNGHRTVTMGTPFGYIIAGDYSAENNLRLVLEARAQVGGNFLAGVATDGQNPDKQIDCLSDNICYAMEHKLCPPQNFLGVGGMKIFRDLIYQMRGMMRADHKFFKSHGQYDFPQKKWKTSMMMYLVGWMMGNKKLKAKMGDKMNEGMIADYKKVVENA